MAELVNLRRARKQAKRRAAEAEAESRRLVHGRSKAERALQQSRNDHARKQFDRHRIDRGDEP